MKHRALILFFIFAVVISLVWKQIPLENGINRLKKVPLEGTGFYGKDIPLTEVEVNFFKNVSLLKRKYLTEEGSFSLIVLDGTNNRHAVHDPKYCFEGWGWKVIKEVPLPLPGGGAAALYTLEKKGVKREVLAWYSDKERQFFSPYEYWWRTSLRRATLGVSGDEPLLILIQSERENPNWEQILHELPSLNHL